MPDSEPPSVPSRRDVIARHKEGGGRVAGVFPVHYPRALLRAFGILPVEVWGPPRVDTELGDAHLQAYTCSIVRAGLSFLQRGGLDVVDFLMVPHACDSLQGLGSVLLDFIEPRQTTLTFYLPRGGGSPALDYLAAELRRLYERLAEATGSRPSDDALAAAIAEDEAADALLGRLLAERRSIDLTDRELYRVARAREFVPAEEFRVLAEQALAMRSPSARTGIPIMLSGVVPEPMDVLDSVDRAGGLVVADDLMCTGRRVYPPGRSGDPFVRMAQRLLGGPPDSTLGSVTADRIRHLRGIARESGARAVIFYIVKFCEVEQFYLPQLRKALEADGLRTVTIEADVNQELPHQSVTRLEALLETAA